MLVQSFIDRVRPLVGVKSWDYIVLWKLSNDQRCIEWVDCCCGGSEHIENGGDEIGFQSCSSNLPCRDVMFPHPRVTSCDLLDQLPSSMILDSGVHAQTLMSNQASWLNYSHNSDSSISQETIGTRVLIPLSVGLLELFVTKQVPEDEQVIDFIRSQCNFFVDDPHTLTNSDLSKENLPHDISIDRIHLTSSPLNNNSNIFLEAATAYDVSAIFDHQNGLIPQETTMHDHQSNSMMMSNASRWINEPAEGNVEEQMNDDSFICENNRSDESDPNDDEDDAKYRRRTGKGPQSKNLVAERKRRKKLNDRLYSLRALVPKISKLDRASILGDAIDYVKELQKQVKDLQIELEEQSDEEDPATKTTGHDDTNQNSVIVRQNGTKRGHKHEHGNFLNGFHDKGSISANMNNINHVSSQSNEMENTNEKVQQMEPQVQVFQLDGNDFFVKVFCEHKSGGFVRLMEALNSLGLEVTNVNATRHTCLVSSIFKVEKQHDETVQADHVKESLLELTRNPSRMWLPNVAQDHRSEHIINNGSNVDDDYHDYTHHHSLLHTRQFNSHHLQHLQH